MNAHTQRLLRQKSVREILAALMPPSRRRIVSIGAMVTLVAVGGAVTGLAIGAPPPVDPISIEADRLDVDVATGAATLSGAVTIRRGDLVVTCTKAEAKFDREARVLWAHGDGPVVATFRETRAEAKELELDAPHQRLELRGGVRVHRPGADLTAQSAVFEGQSSRVQLTGVKAVLSAAPSAALLPSAGTSPAASP